MDARVVVVTKDASRWVGVVEVHEGRSHRRNGVPTPAVDSPLAQVRRREARRLPLTRHEGKPLGATSTAQGAARGNVTAAMADPMCLGFANREHPFGLVWENWVGYSRSAIRFSREMEWMRPSTI